MLQLNYYMSTAPHLPLFFFSVDWGPGPVSGDLRRGRAAEIQNPGECLPGPGHHPHPPGGSHVHCLLHRGAGFPSGQPVSSPVGKRLLPAKRWREWFLVSSRKLKSLSLCLGQLGSFCLSHHPQNISHRSTVVHVHPSDLISACMYI